MGFLGQMSLFIGVFIIQLGSVPTAFSGEINLDLEASTLKKGYAIRLLKPLPRRNSGCETIFRNGKVLESCEPNYGFDPAIEGVIRNYCEWNLNTHYQKNNQAKWLEPYFNPDLIAITNAKVGHGHKNEYRSMIQRARNVEYIIYRWIELEFNDQITGSKLGSLKCYPARVNDWLPGKSELFGNYYYHYGDSKEENERNIKSGLSIGDVLDQLEGFVQIVKTN